MINRNTNIFFFWIMIVLIVSFVIASVPTILSCVIPENDMKIVQNTTFCSGEYSLPLGITIGAHNIHLDCAGAILVGDGSADGITIKNRKNSKITGCNIQNYSRGIYLFNSNYNIIENNTIYNISIVGIDLTQSSDNNYIKNNSAFDVFEGFRIIGDNNVIDSNRVLNNHLMMRGIAITQNSINNSVINNFINNSEYGIYISSSSNNTLKNNNISYSNASALSLSGSYNNIFINNTYYNSSTYYLLSISNYSVNNSFYNETVELGFKGIYISGYNNRFYNTKIKNVTLTNIFSSVSIINVSFYNSTFDNSLIYGDRIFIYQYININVTDNSTKNPINSANCSFYNQSGFIFFNYSSSADGNLPENIEIREYVYDGAFYFDTNYTINCTKSGYNKYSSTFNITSQLKLNVNLTQETNPPTFSNAINGSLDFKRYSNFTANITISDDFALNHSIFSTNASGSWQNDSAMAIDGLTEFRFNNSKNITIDYPNTICWVVYANDSWNNKGTSDTYCFEVSDYISPVITLLNPVNNYYNDTSDPYTIIFNCSATDNNALSNISLYLTNKSNQSFILNETRTISGTLAFVNFSLSIPNGDYTWNCIAYDSNNNFEWGENRSLKIDYTLPSQSGGGGGGGGGREISSLPTATEVCTPNWDCTKWKECTPAGTRKRSCLDLNFCYTDEGKPSESEKCEYVDEKSEQSNITILPELELKEEDEEANITTKIADIKSITGFAVFQWVRKNIPNAIPTIIFIAIVILGFYYSIYKKKLKS